MTAQSPISPSSARDATNDVIVRGMSAGAASVQLVRAVLGELAKARVGLEKTEAACAGCGTRLSSAVDANAHLATCPRHPALDRLRAVRRAVEMVPALARGLGFEPTALDDSVRAALASTEEVKGQVVRGSFVKNADSLESALELLSGPKRLQYPRLVAIDGKELANAEQMWERLVHRDTDPCPFCGTVTPLDHALAHARGCGQHPAAIASRPAEEWLTANLGRSASEALLMLSLERERLLGSLTVLIEACASFDSDLGRGDEGYRSRSYDEKVLEDATAAASAVASLGPRGYVPTLDPATEAATGPDFARPVWRALLRVTENGPSPGSHGGTLEDVARLEEVVEGSIALRLEHPDMFTCPTCGRPGLRVHQVVRHILACPAHPAIARDRDAEARLELAVGYLREKKGRKDLPSAWSKELGQVERLWPSGTSDDDDGEARTRFVEGAREHLASLIVPEVRATYQDVTRSARDVAGVVSTWQRYTEAMRAQCPYCECGLGFPELVAHLATCPQHASNRRAAEREQHLARLGVTGLEAVGKVRREADEARLALAALVECISSFTGSFGDDERGRGIVYEWLLPAWNVGRQRARDTLTRLRSSAPSVEAKRNSEKPAGAQALSRPRPAAHDVGGRVGELSFELDPAWFAQQLKLARSARSARGVRLRKEHERLLIGLVDGVLILAFPHFEVSTMCVGTGEGWFSLNPQRLARILGTFGAKVRVRVGHGEIHLDRFKPSVDALELRLGRNDPALAALVARIDELAAEECYRRLVNEAHRNERVAAELRWHRAENTVNTAPPVELIRDGSLIVYRRPEAPAEAEPARAIVDMKRVIGNTVVLCCHDFRGAEITVDPRWVMHVGC